MTTLTGRDRRTIAGYLVTLLDYPRWFIEREIDFTNCHLGGRFEANDARCSSCAFGDACRWLNANLDAPSVDAEVDELVAALRTSVIFLRTSRSEQEQHAGDCQCQTCRWLRKAKSFLRQHRHKT